MVWAFCRFGPGKNDFGVADPLCSRGDFTCEAWQEIVHRAGLAPQSWRAERPHLFLPLIRITCRLAPLETSGRR